MPAKVSGRVCLFERQEQVGAAKLEALRRGASAGEEAYERGEYTAIEDNQALDRFFEDIAGAADKA